MDTQPWSCRVLRFLLLSASSDTKEQKRRPSNKGSDKEKRKVVINETGAAEKQEQHKLGRARVLEWPERHCLKSLLNLVYPKAGTLWQLEPVLVRGCAGTADLSAAR